MAQLKLKVLVADDSSTVHMFFRDLAEHSPVPFDVLRAENGRQCVEFLNRGGVNLAFIDVNMPDMSGMEAIGAARFSGNKTFVALMYSNASPRRLQLARQLKAYEFLKKPFNPEDVVRILRTYVRVTIPTRALIVDDSATVRRIVKKVLTNSIFNIDETEAGDGKTALAECRGGEFDVIFLDCNMPGLDGLETFERIMEQDPQARVIMMTGERNEEKRRWALERGAFAFLYKPFYPETVDRELHWLFDLPMPELGLYEEKADGPLMVPVG
jgi:CheY-like chemotaxis protein